MLTDLRVRDLGVVEDLSLRLGPGMTALTGETGAGKTLLVEALQLVLGGRATPTLVRAGADEAIVEARFETLDEHGQPVETILARSLPTTGRSRAWIDGRMAPLTQLGALAERLVDIHGQHEQHSLLAPAAQRRALDAFAGTDTERAAVEAAKRRLVEIDVRLAEIGGDAAQRARDVDVLTHQVAEIQHAAITDTGEEEALAIEVARLSDLSALRHAAAQAYDALHGTGTADPGALDALGDSVASLGDRPPLLAWAHRLRAAVAELEDVADDLRKVVDTWDDDPARLEELLARQRTLLELRHKYGPTLEDVVAFGDQARRRLVELHDAETIAARLEVERVAAEGQRVEAEATLRHRRQLAAPLLAEAVVDRLAALAMGGARLEVDVAATGSGDPIRFLLGANQGESLQPLHKVASGGELARAMLALRLVAVGGPMTMVFDEVDAGVGGQAALALAAALHEVARGRQVFVVTHLPQVAAFADEQVAVQKSIEDGRTITRAKVLGAEERVIELSRMLSGQPESTTARAHAEELLVWAAGAATSTTDRADVV